VREKRAQAFSHQPFADVRVAVAVRPERGVPIVHVDGAEPVQADAVVDFRERLVDPSGVGHVDP
jgi:hypothetical protein